jgi:thermitase
MKRGLLSALLAFGLVLVTQQGFSAEYLVKYKNNKSLNNLRMSAMDASMGMMIIDGHKPGKYIRVDLDKKSELMTVVKLLANPNVEWVVPNFELKAFSQPADVFAVALKEQWAITKINAEKAWGRATNKGKKNIIIGVIDTGVDYKHKNLAPNMLPGYDFRNNDNDPMDETSDKNPGHGTHCAGIAAATGAIDGGIVGAGPDVSVMPIRFLGADGSGDLNGGIKSIDYAIEKGVHVISASWGATVPRAQAGPLIEAVKRADDRGLIFVAAAANDGRNNDTTDVFPANSATPNMISVAASDSADAKPSWSNFGKGSVHIASPGLKIMSTLPGDNYGELSGTSMATPLVSGIVAFLKSQDPSLTGAQIRALLQTTGAKVAIETACNCRVDLFAAVDHLMSGKPWLVPAAATIPEGGSITVAMKNGKAPIKFASSNTSIVNVNDSGVVTAGAKGTATITATDADGVAVTSLDFNVGAVASENPAPPGGECPLGDPALCQIICGIMPEAPWCQ